MLLENSVVAVFGAGGHVGSGVSRRLAAEGASVLLSGRRLRPLEQLAREIRASGGKAEASVVDALDEAAVERYLQDAVPRAGRLDAVFNAVGPALTGNDIVCPSTEVPLATFTAYLQSTVASQFLTARAAARHMIPRHAGTVIFLTATPGRGVAPLMAGASAGHAAIEGLIRCLATEWSPLGIRVVGICSGGMPETPRIQEVVAAMARRVGSPTETLAHMVRDRTLLKRMPTVAETARVVAFLASDYASTLTGVIVNASCGETLD